MSLFMGLSPEARETKILVTDRNEVRLKARLRCPPQHPKALSWLIEAVALWEGAPVRAVLCAGGAHRTHAATFRADWFPDFGGPLYSLEVVEGPLRGTLHDTLRGLGTFRDLKQLRMDDALRRGDGR
jgi:uncharacterized protein YggU (UPF0235/DUF167 family)